MELDSETLKNWQVISQIPRVSRASVHANPQCSIILKLCPQLPSKDFHRNIQVIEIVGKKKHKTKTCWKYINNQHVNSYEIHWNNHKMKTTQKQITKSQILIHLHALRPKERKPRSEKQCKKLKCNKRVLWIMEHRTHSLEDFTTWDFSLESRNHK